MRARAPGRSQKQSAAMDMMPAPPANAVSPARRAAGQHADEGKDPDLRSHLQADRDSHRESLAQVRGPRRLAPSRSHRLGENGELEQRADAGHEPRSGRAKRRHAQMPEDE